MTKVHPLITTSPPAFKMLWIKVTLLKVILAGFESDVIVPPSSDISLIITEVEFDKEKKTQEGREEIMEPLLMPAIITSLALIIFMQGFAPHEREEEIWKVTLWFPALYSKSQELTSITTYSELVINKNKQNTYFVRGIKERRAIQRCKKRREKVWAWERNKIEEKKN